MASELCKKKGGGEGGEFSFHEKDTGVGVGVRESNNKAVNLATKRQQAASSWNNNCYRTGMLHFLH